MSLCHRTEMPSPLFYSIYFIRRIIATLLFQAITLAKNQSWIGLQSMLDQNVLVVV